MPATPTETALTFGPFELRPGQKLLLERSKPVRLGSRAFELLCALIERPGEIVARDELVARVWPRSVVEETSLRVQLASLRRTLGDGRNGARYITNDRGRGYSFVGQVNVKGDSSASALDPALAEPPHNLPQRLTSLVGRDETIAALGAQLSSRRLVSLVGPGGMGKSTVALAVARERLSSYEGGAWFVDLAQVSGPSLVSHALGAVLGIAVDPSDPWPALAGFLHNRQMLIVLDNCEHVIAAASQLATGILRCAPAVNVLVTSREALYEDGEWIHRLPALATPSVSDALDCEAAMTFPSVQLFVERAAARSAGFSLSERNVAIVQQLCRQLDGMPLAIELAAGGVEALGLPRLAARLDDMFRVMAIGQRTAPPRHRTLHAMLDWSYDLLTDTEKVVLRRLSIIHGAFTLELAGRSVSDEQLSAAEVAESVLSLCAKSLVNAEPRGETMHHRLLNTTRVYAMSKFIESEEAPTFPTPCPSSRPSSLQGEK